MVEFVLVRVVSLLYMVELVTSVINIMNDRFETLWQLGILPGLVIVASRRSSPQLKLNRQKTQHLHLSRNLISRDLVPKSGQAQTAVEAAAA
jgi:uncharacterized membrane protein